MRAFNCIRLVAGAVLLGLLVQAPAQAAGWLEKTITMTGPRYDAALPACEAALDTIAARFAQKESQYWNSGAHILGFERVRQIAFSPWAPGTIPRRFCTARALVSDGRKHAVSYWIGEDTGMIGMDWGVEWCVEGFDRDWSFNPRCKMARP